MTRSTVALGEWSAYSDLNIDERELIMGFNTSMIILNDCLGDIEKDPDFGKKVSQAVSSVDTQRYLSEEAGRPFHGVDVSAGCSVNAATVIETHHADGTSIIAFGGNMGLNMGLFYPYGAEDEEIRILRALAMKYGFGLRKLPARK